jgi:hypothetical protein
MSTTNANAFLHAVRIGKYNAGAPAPAEMWKYAFPLAWNEPVEDVPVRFSSAGGTGSHGSNWIGMFECARSRHVDVLPWPAANAIVVAAANALYIVDPNNPEQFTGLAAPVAINDVTFDESARHMFVADSLRIHAFSSDLHLQWVSEPLDGYDARFRACGRRVLTVQLTSEPSPGYEEGPLLVIRLRIEDGTVLRSRFRQIQDYWRKRLAA